MTTPTAPEQAKYIASHLLTHDATASLALRSLADQVEALQPALETERAAANLYAKQVAHWIEKHDALLAQQLEATESRDAYAKAADTMYAAHKVERDEYVRCYNLLTQNAEKHLKELQIRQDCISFFTARARALASENIALQTDHDALKAELEIARMVPYVAAMSEIAKERDELKKTLEEIETKVDALIVERDALAHDLVIERARKTIIEQERDALKAELARPESTAVSLMRAENAALKDAARLALTELIEIKENGLSWDAEYDKAIAALKAVL